jgi:hypothetical protein
MHPNRCRDEFTARPFRSVHPNFRGANMPDIDSIIQNISTIYQLIASNTWSATLSVVGLLLLLIAIYAAYRAISSKPEDTPTYLRAFLFVSLIGGIIFSAAGPSIALFYVSEGPIATISPEHAFDKLKDNERVYWVIRLIPFNPQKAPQLAIGNLSSLGPKEQQYSFVAPYEELRGYSVERAVQMTGGTYHLGDHVSAIIFQLDPHQVYPANARGLLQVVQNVENNLDDDAHQKYLLKKTDILKDEDIRDFNNVSLYTWRWDNYRARYQRYCEAAHKFRCDTEYSAQKLIGGLYKDWHPIGAAQEEQEDPCQTAANDFCKITDWNELKKQIMPHFGSRVFLIGNLELSEIGNRYLIEFENPSYQVIPDIGFRRPRS